MTSRAENLTDIYSGRSAYRIFANNIFWAYLKCLFVYLFILSQFEDLTDQQ